MKTVFSSNSKSFTPSHGGLVGDTVARVSTDGGSFTIHPSRQSPDLLALQSRYKVRQWALVSAVNPHGLSISPLENQRRHAQLLSVVTAENLPVFEAELRWQAGEAVHSAVWIGGIPLHQAQSLARDFAQGKLWYGDFENTPAIRACLALTFEI